MENLPTTPRSAVFQEVILSLNSIALGGELRIPAAAKGLVLFTNGSGKNRHSPENKLMAKIMRDAGLGTLLFDLLTQEEERIDQQTRHMRFDVSLLARRLMAATGWVKDNPTISHLRIGYFGSSIAGGAALIAATESNYEIGAVVSHGGRPDLANKALAEVVAPTLLIVSGEDDVALQLNKEAFDQLQCTKELKIVPGIAHLFENLGAQEKVARLIADWFLRYLCEVPDSRTN